MAETIAVIFVFFIIIVIGFVFYGRVMKGSIESQRDESSQLKSIEIAQRIMFLPEIQCSDDVVTEIRNCIDMLKINAAQKIMKANELYYYDLLEYSDINIYLVYPNANNWVLYSRKPMAYKTKFVTNTPISVYNPVTRKNGFGVLSIETYI